MSYLGLNFSQHESSTNESDAPKNSFGGEIGLSIKHAKSSVESSESDESDDGGSKELSKFCF